MPDSVEKQWLTLLMTAADAPSIPSSITDPQVQQAWERLQFKTFGGMAKDRYTKEQRVYTEEQQRLQEATEKGMRQGIEETTKKIIHNMFDLGWTNDTIAAATKLPIETVDELRHAIP